MTHTLFIHLTACNQTAEHTAVDWLLFDALEHKIAGGQQQLLSSVLEQTAEHSDVQIIVLVPGEQVLQTTLNIPAGQKRHLQRTLPFLVEEYLATPIEDMHLCVGSVQHHQARVLAVSHTVMQQWLELLKSHHIEPDCLIPDTSAAGLASELEIIIDPQAATFSCHPLALIKTDLHNLTLIADHFIDSFAEGQRPASGTLLMIESLNESQKSAAEALATQFEVEGIKIHRQTISHGFDYSCEKLLSKLHHKQPSSLVNLLTGSYRNPTQRQRNKAPNWLALAATIVLCIVIKLVFDLGSGIYLNYQSTQVDNTITALYQELFPQDKRIVDARVQMQNHLNKATHTNTDFDFMFLFGHMAEALENLDNSSQLQQLRYNDKNQTLLVDINVRDIQQLEQLKQRIESHNISATILSANKERQWIKGRVRLSL